MSLSLSISRATNFLLFLLFFGCKAAESENNHYKLPFAACQRILGRAID